MNALKLFWYRAFLEKRPSLSLGLFRLAVALTVGCHVIPSFLHMDENYLATAFKVQNPSFFPVPILQLAAASPDWMVWLWVWVFFLSWISFTIGLWTQASAIAMTLACYYFYALNSYHIGTLSFDILLVTLVLVCVTGYSGDFLSIDSLRRGKANAYKRPRSFFIQRLLQLQVAATFWYTALNKMAAGGNWLTENPYYCLMHYPAIGVVRNFPGKLLLGQHPALCHGLGFALITFEILVPLAWFIPRMRKTGIILGVAFHLMLWGTLHVPTIFLFLFPPLMFLFIRPETLVGWIENKQAESARQTRLLLLYDGGCGFCLESIKRLRVLDLFGTVDPLDFHTIPDLTRLHPALTARRCHSEMVLLESDGRLSGGFEAFARLSRKLVLLWPVFPLVSLPGVGIIGSRVYRWIAEHRYLLHRNPACINNQCAVSGVAKNDASSN